MDKLSSILMNIGRSIPRYQNMASLFPRSVDLRKSLTEYFVIVVKLCHKVLTTSRASILLHFFSSYTDPLASYEAELETWANAVKDEISIQSIMIVKMERDEKSKARDLAKMDRQATESSRNEKVKNRILDVCTTHDHRTPWKQIRKKGNVLLFRKDKGYLDWRSEDESCALVYTGSHGSGKTVLSANIVDDLYLDTDQKNRYIAYFFCRRDEAQSLRSRTIIGSFARQLLEAHIGSEKKVKLKVPNLSTWSVHDICDLLRSVFLKISTRV